jgi:molybdate transport system substrate-binding protein
MFCKRLLASAVFGAALIVAQFPAGAARAADLQVRTALTFSGALEALAPGYEKATGNKVYAATAGGGSSADLFVLQRSALDPLAKNGSIDGKTLTDLVTVRVGLAVKAGKPAPDISTVDKLKQALLAAKSVTVSRAATGQYVTTELFTKLGIADQMKGKVKQISGAVGEAVARGDAEIGFQQMSELLPVKGITVIRIPEAVQRVTVVSAAMAAGAKSPEAARKFIDYVKSPAAAAALKTLDLEVAK